MAQQVKNLPAIPELQVRLLGWKDPLEGGMATTPVSLPGKSRGQRSLGGPQRRRELDTTACEAQAASRSTS